MPPKPSITDASFPALYQQSQTATLVVFGAAWCQHCKRMVPLIQALAKQYAGKVTVLKVDIEKAPRTASDFGVAGVPAFVFVKNGEIIKRMAGEFSEAVLRQQLDSLL